MWSQMSHAWSNSSRALLRCTCTVWVFFFDATATAEVYTLSLHDALPIWRCGFVRLAGCHLRCTYCDSTFAFHGGVRRTRSEEHTSELQSHHDLVCRLLLEKKKQENFESSQLIIIAVPTPPLPDRDPPLNS